MKAIAAGLLVLSVALSTAVPVDAQGPLPYGAPITLDQAKKVLAGAEAEATRRPPSAGRPRSSRI